MLESRLLPNLNESVKQEHARKPAKSKPAKTTKDIRDTRAARCEKKSRLVLEYRAATELYSTAVAELSRRIGIGTIDGYQKLHEADTLLPGLLLWRERFSPQFCPTSPRASSRIRSPQADAQRSSPHQVARQWPLGPPSAKPNPGD